MTPAGALETKQEIHEVVLRYCRGIDRMDLDLVRSCYHSGGIDWHTGFHGTVEELIPWLQTKLPRFAGTMHIVGNHQAWVEGDRALSETYGTAVHWGEPSTDRSRNFTSGFRYIDLMTRRAGRWAISERHAVREWTRNDVGTHLGAVGSGPRGRRDEDDSLYVLGQRLEG